MQSRPFPGLGRYSVSVESKDLVNVELAWPSEHFLRRAVDMSFGERLAPPPGDKVIHRAPPGFHFVVALRILIIDESARFMI